MSNDTTSDKTLESTTHSWLPSERATALNNPDDAYDAKFHFPLNFTKGLHHDSETGLVADPKTFEARLAAIEHNMSDPFIPSLKTVAAKCSAWHAPTAGMIYQFDEPELHPYKLPSAPQLESKEFIYEMGEIYELALLRDQPLTDFHGATTNQALVDSLSRLNQLDYSLTGKDGRSRKHIGGKLDPHTLFRGSTPRVETGPYLSQFLLIGNDQPGSETVHGKIRYGALQIDQRVIAAKPQNHLTDWKSWLKAQNGEPLAIDEVVFDSPQTRRFILVPRDLATYVQSDTLCETYRNACYLLLSMNAPLAIGFNRFLSHKSDANPFAHTAFATTQQQSSVEAEISNHYGGPYMLALISEAATRAFKAVEHHQSPPRLRLRPDALAARIYQAEKIEKKFPELKGKFTRLVSALQPTLTAIGALNNSNGEETTLLPLALGTNPSPLSPYEDHVHTVVAGACVTVLKALFDTTSVFVRRNGQDGFWRHQRGDLAVEYTASPDGSKLVEMTNSAFLSLEGELNKLADNIALGRNMAGMQFFSEYYDYLRFGEQVALELLEEQVFSHPLTPFMLAVPTFAGNVQVITNG